MSDLPLPAPRLSVTGHLTRLRSRLVRCVLAILLVFCALFPLAQQLYSFVSQPLRDFLPSGATMIATGVTSPFLAPPRPHRSTSSGWSR